MTYNREDIGAHRAAAAKTAAKDRNMRLSRKISGYSLLLIGNLFWWSQVTCWGLSAFHVNSGLYGPFSLLLVLSGVISSGVCMGMLLTAKKTSD